MTPIISVIMTNKGHEAYIEQSVASVLGQKGITNFELLIMNDDPEIKLNLYESRDNRIIVFEDGKSLGQAKRLEQGIELAKGEYICLLDADDWMVENRFQICLNRAWSDVNVVHGDKIVVHQDGTRTYNKAKEFNINEFRKRNMFSTGSLMLRAKCAKQIKFPFAGYGNLWGYMMAFYKKFPEGFQYVNYPMFYYRDYTSVIGVRDKRVKHRLYRAWLRKKVNEILDNG